MSFTIMFPFLVQPCWESAAPGLSYEREAQVYVRNSSPNKKAKKPKQANESQMKMSADRLEGVTETELTELNELKECG